MGPLAATVAGGTIGEGALAATVVVMVAGVIGSDRLLGEPRKQWTWPRFGRGFGPEPLPGACPEQQERRSCFHVF